VVEAPNIIILGLKMILALNHIFEKILFEVSHGPCENLTESHLFKIAVLADFWQTFANIFYIPISSTTAIIGIPYYHFEVDILF
jgi:hypothetical protein